jgi:hypothetical protein
VQLAASSIAEQHKKSDAMPLFDVNGASVGYVAGAVFYAQSIQTTPPSVPGEQPKRESGGFGLPLWAWGAIGLGAAGVLGAVALGGSGSSGGGDDPVNCNVATPNRPASCPAL